MNRPNLCFERRFLQYVKNMHKILKLLIPNKTKNCAGNEKQAEYVIWLGGDYHTPTEL